MRVFDLTFKEPELEAEFWAKRDAASRQQARIAAVLGILMLTLFGFLIDQMVSGGMAADHVLRYGLAVPSIGLAWLFTYFERTDRYRQWLLAIAALNCCIVVAYDTVFTDLPTDWAHSANMLITSFNFTFLALRFRLALLVAVLQTLLFEVSLLQHVGSDWLYFTYSNTFFISIQVVSGTAGFMLEKSYRQNFLQARSLDDQRAIAEHNHALSDSLLLNILPSQVADRLRENPGIIADRFDEVSVLFADLVNFTGQSQSIEPEELVVHLDGIFSRFDAIVEQHQLEKIKTIGDSYMAVAGVPTARADHAQAIAHTALGMIDAVRGLTWPSGEPVRVRVGIASGPVVAGVIGRKKFAFDLWGDTVNTASRMESNGEADRIRVTEQTRSLLLDGFNFEGPQQLDVKGKGMLNTWFLVETKAQ